MTRRILFTLLVIACCNVAFSQNDDKANVLAIERKAADAYSKHAIPSLLSVFSDDATIITKNGQLINKQQLAQYVQPINGFVVSDMDVKIKGNIAVVTGIQTETGKDTSCGEYSTKARFTDVMERKNGIWTIVASQATLANQ